MESLLQFLSTLYERQFGGQIGWVSYIKIRAINYRYAYNTTTPKNPLRGNLNTYAGFCRDHSRMTIYLGWWLPITSCGSLTCVSTALHTSKDLAVSPHVLPRELFPKESGALSFASVSARTSGIATDGCYPLPCSQLSLGCVRTFLPETFVARRSSCITSMQHPV